MSRIWGIIVGVCAVVGVGAIVFYFAGARGDVAKKKVMKTIDSWLGESEVQRAEIERGINGMEVAVDKLQTAKIRAKGDAERLSNQTKDSQKKIADSKLALGKLREDLKKFDTDTSYSVSYGSKTYTKKDDLNKLADKVIEGHKKLVDQNKVLEDRLAAYEQTASTLNTNYTDAKKKLEELKDQLKELDSKIALAKAQKEAAAALDESSKTFADGVKSIEDKMRDLGAATETDVQKQAEKWKDLTSKSSSSDSDDVSKIIKDSKSTSDEIDKLLGDK
jgi:chromosome segregation ATPase